MKRYSFAEIRDMQRAGASATPGPKTLLVRFHYIHKSGAEIVQEERWPLSGWCPTPEQVERRFRHHTRRLFSQQISPLAVARVETELLP